jgi:hypothetical protein
VKRTHGWPTHRHIRDNIIKMNLKETAWGCPVAGSCEQCNVTLGLFTGCSKTWATELQLVISLRKKQQKCWEDYSVCLAGNAVRRLKADLWSSGLCHHWL